MKKIMSAFIVLIILAVSLTSLKLFCIGKSANSDSLAVHVSEDGRQLTILIQTMDSAMAISNVKYQLEDTVLYLTAHEVLRSPLYRSGEKCIYYEIAEETEIWLNGKPIWSK